MSQIANRKTHGKARNKSQVPRISQGRVGKRQRRKPIRLGMRQSTIGDDFFNQLDNGEQSQENVLRPTRRGMRQSTIGDDFFNQLENEERSQENTSITENNDQRLEMEETNSSTTNVNFSLAKNNDNEFQVTVMKTLNEILVRIGLSEKHVAQLDSHIVELKKSFKVTKSTQFNSINPAVLIPFELPINSKNGLQKFDEKLFDLGFMDRISNVLQKIGGNSGESNGEQVLVPLFTAIISPKFWSKTTWSGRSGRGQPPKIPFKMYNNVVQLICKLCRDADQSYSDEACISHIKYKILKHAYRLADSETTNSDTESITS